MPPSPPCCRMALWWSHNLSVQGRPQPTYASMLQTRFLQSVEVHCKWPQWLLRSKCCDSTTKINHCDHYKTKPDISYSLSTESGGLRVTLMSPSSLRLLGHLSTAEGDASWRSWWLLFPVSWNPAIMMWSSPAATGRGPYNGSSWWPKWDTPETAQSCWTGEPRDDCSPKTSHPQPLSME